MRKDLYLWVGAIIGGLSFPALLLGVVALLEAIISVHTFNGHTALETELHEVTFILPLLLPMLALVGIVMGVAFATLIHNAGKNHEPEQG